MPLDEGVLWPPVLDVANLPRCRLHGRSCSFTGLRSSPPQATFVRRRLPGGRRPRCRQSRKFGRRLALVCRRGCRAEECRRELDHELFREDASVHWHHALDAHPTGELFVAVTGRHVGRACRYVMTGAALQGCTWTEFHVDKSAASTQWTISPSRPGRPRSEAVQTPVVHLIAGGFRLLLLPVA